MNPEAGVGRAGDRDPVELSGLLAPQPTQGKLLPLSQRLLMVHQASLPGPSAGWTGASRSGPPLALTGHLALRTGHPPSWGCRKQRPHHRCLGERHTGGE